VDAGEALNTMTYKGYTARVEYDERDNIYAGRILDIRSMVSFHGETVAQLRAEFELAVEDWRLALFFKQKRRTVVKGQLLEPASQARLVDGEPPLLDSSSTGAPRNTLPCPVRSPRSS